MLYASAALTLGLAALASSAVAAPVADTPVKIASSGAAPAKEARALEARDDWANTDHCPGGSIGDADKCTFQATRIYDTKLERWTQYGDWFDACNSNSGISQAVSDSVAVGNSVTSTTEISIGIESEGFSAGISQSFSESWTTTNTVTSQQSIDVPAGSAGNINLSNRYIVAEGRTKINYGSTKDGHYVWYTGNSDVFTLDPTSVDVFNSNVHECPASPPNRGEVFYNVADYDAVKAGSYAEYTYDD